MSGLVILGATGSVGRQAVEVADLLGVHIVGLAAGRPSEKLVELAESHPDAAVAVAGGSGEERERFASRLGGRVSFGSEAVAELAATSGALVLNGIVGSAGLASTLAALSAGNRLALANKESLVAGGPLVRAALERGGGELIPVDSEHSALHQLLQGRAPGEVESLVLTASGGPFRGRSLAELEAVTPEQALAHPTWKMGGRISIDSATLVNKGLEVIEAHLLFDIGFDRIEVVVHPQSVVHSLVRLVDGALLAHVGHTDMRVPIAYAITHPERRVLDLPPFPLAGLRLDFESPDLEAFPALDLAYRAGRAGGSMPAVFNAADEVAVAAFLQGRLGFASIPTVIESTMASMSGAFAGDLAEVMAIDAESRSVAASMVAGAC